MGIVAVLCWFFGTELGSAVRATGSNPNMARAQGINTNGTKMVALILSNALVGTVRRPVRLSTRAPLT